MSNDGTGLRGAELDARTIYDIACIRADASKATREDVEFKAIALRNYKAIAALSAVAPPADWVLVPREPTLAMENAWLQHYGNTFRGRYAAMLAASPAAPAQPEGGEDDLHVRIEELENELQEARETVAEEYERDAGRALRGLMKLIGHEWDEPMTAIEQADVIAEHIREVSRPAPAQQAVTDEMVEMYCEAVNEYLGSLTPKQWEIERFDHHASIRRTARVGLTAALASNAAASAADAKAAEGAK